METKKYDYGMIGLGTMGRNLVLNMCDHGFTVAGFDKSEAQVAELNKNAKDGNIFGTLKIEEFVGALKTPRVIMLLVPAGKAVDAVVDELKPMLDKEDLIMDCGNSHFTDTEARTKRLLEEGLHFMGVGISGGESGARFGPSIMPGGDKGAYQRVASVLEAVSAKVNAEPCVTWLGPGAAGHYVKMVHNGIEYGIMQMIAETYHLIKTCTNMGNDELHTLFATWNKGILKSFLIEISADVFAQKDDLTGNMLVDMILDKAKQKGTGQWASQSAMDMSVPIPTIDAAVSARDISALKSERMAAKDVLSWKGGDFENDKKELLSWLEHALYFAMVTSYAQGMSLLQYASKEYKYDLKLQDVAAIWRGGCIIRAAMLEDIRAAYSADATMPNLMTAPALAHNLVAYQDDLRFVLKTAIDMGVPMPAMMSALAYYDGYRSGWLPANLIQAQRDYFGAHTYERTDREGTFHTQWKQTQQ